MKRIFILLLNFSTISLIAQSVSINVDGGIANSSALLDVSSTNKGFLPPRMTEAQRIAIATPVQGLIIYCTNCGTNGELEIYNGTAWTMLTGTLVTPASVTSVTIGTQIWQSTNLDVTTYRDGTIIPQVADPTTWANLTTGAWCYLNNEPVNGITYGKLYNWYAVAGIYDSASLNNPSLRKQLAADGWHVPSDSEWTTLTTFLGGETVAGGKMKEAGIAHWFTPNQDATNSSGFTAIPGGLRWFTGDFSPLNDNCQLWSISELDISSAWFIYLMYDSGNIFRTSMNKEIGFSVRCVKN